MRRWAKQHARERALPYGQALEDAARSAGFGSWHEVCKAQRSAARAGSGLELPVDPALPPRFDDSPNESRSNAELDVPLPTTWIHQAPARFWVSAEA